MYFFQLPVLTQIQDLQNRLHLLLQKQADHHCLNKNQAGQYVIEKAKKGLMSNVHDIVKDTFFLDKPVGEFADVFFEEIIFEISNYM